MMTNEERREVARKLRESRESAFDFRERLSDEGIDVFCDDQADYYLIHKAATGSIPAEHMHLCDYAELHDRLADLIYPEPERTCRVIGHNLSCDECQCEEWALSCGHEVINESDGYPPSYCSECGAKVVKED